MRDRYNNHRISLHGLWTAIGRLEAKLNRVLAHPGRDTANRRFAKHLLHEQSYIFTFLYCPGLDATNNVSERAIRALIGARKNWGGNRTVRGARAQALLTSILQTAKQQGKKPFDVLVELLCGKGQAQDSRPRAGGYPRGATRVAHPIPRLHAQFPTSWRHCLRRLLPLHRFESGSRINLPHSLLAIG